MLCDFPIAAGEKQCSRCGFIDRSATEYVYRNCPHWTAGLGNALAAAIGFATFGQGKRIADLFARRVLGKPGCDCTRRQGDLNRFGEAVAESLRKWLAIGYGLWIALRQKAVAV